MQKKKSAVQAEPSPSIATLAGAGGALFGDVSFEFKISGVPGEWRVYELEEGELTMVLDHTETGRRDCALILWPSRAIVATAEAGWATIGAAIAEVVSKQSGWRLPDPPIQARGVR